MFTWWGDWKNMKSWEKGLKSHEKLVTSFMDGPFDHDILRTTCHFVKGPNKSIMQKSILISSRQSKSAY